MPSLPFSMLSVLGAEMEWRGHSGKLYCFQASMATSFLLGLANIRTWWEPGGEEEGRSQGVLPPLPLSVCLSGISGHSGVSFNGSKSLRTNAQWFQLLLGSPRSSSYLRTKGSNGFLLLLMYGLLCKWWARWFSRSAHSILHARTHRTCLLVLEH